MPPTLRPRLLRMVALLQADHGRVEAEFPFFLRKRAPVTGVESLLEYQGRLIADVGPAGVHDRGPKSWCR